MLSNTGLYATQPSRFEKYENGDDFLSYAPISDLSLSSTSPIPDLSNQLNDPFLSCFTNSENFDSFDQWENTLSGLDTTSWETSKLENIKDLQSPFDSPLMDWPNSPMSSHASNGAFSPITGSSKHSSASFEDDFYLDVQGKTASNASRSATPQNRSCSPEEPDTSGLSQEEIVKLWTIAFPTSQMPSSLSQAETTSPRIGESTLTMHQKRKSTTEESADLTSDCSISSKKRHVEEKEPRRTSKRSSTSGPSTEKSSYKGSKVNHNLIEKRYRSSLNEKIALLREALPTNYGNSCHSSDDEDVFVKKEEEFTMDGQPPDGKQTTKGAVLSDAARYIRFLEGKVHRLEARLSCADVQAF